MSIDRFPERVGCRLPTGWRTRIEKVSAQTGRSPAEWLRDLIRRALESAERAERRRKAAS